MKHTDLFLLAVLSTATGIAPAQTPAPVLDINLTASGYDSNVDGGIQGDNNDFPEDSFVQMGGFWYFTAQSLATGDELWRTDGTAAGTTLVKDINPGPASSNITWITSWFGARLLFSANDGTNGTELWISDGTAAGTQLLADINPGAGNSSPSRLYLWGTNVYFAADDGTNGTELWVTDTTPGGTFLLADLRAVGSSTPQGFISSPSGTTLLFRCNDGLSGNELWSTDGTAPGTALLADIQPGTGSSSPSGFIQMGSKVYFSANDGTNGIELWATDGTGPGTAMVANLNPGLSSVPDLVYATVWNGELYFEANDGTNGNEVYKTDGVTITMVWDVAPGSGSSNPSDFRVHNGDLYFHADEVTGVGRELRRISAGGAQATLGDINPGTGDSFAFSTVNMFSHNGLLFFACNNGASGAELGVSDGTSGGTGLLADLQPGSTASDPNWFTPINATQLMFTARTATEGRELWVTDGTVAGTQLLVEIDATILTADGQPDDITSFNGKDLLFTARTDATGEELWAWTPGAGASMLLDIRPGTSGSAPTAMTYGWLNGAGTVVFAANDGATGTELWKTDGTTVGTVQVADIWPGTSSSSPANFIYYAGRIYFSANNGVNGTELWATDGTAAGTVMVADIQVGANSGAPSIFCVHQGLLYFRANDGGTGVGSGNELWVTDGTAAGTQLVVDIRPGGAASTPNFITSYNGMLAFTANDGVNGLELWKSDGTAAGTSMVLDLAAGSLSATPQFLIEFNGLLWMRADDAAAIGNELWSTDLTAAGTVPYDLNPGAGDSNPSALRVVGDRLYFNATNGVDGLEPWISDGTAAGTVMLANLAPGVTGSSPDDFTAARNGAYFTGSGGAAVGNELWYTDGTTAGTVMVADINPGPTGSSPSFLTLASGRLFFQADDAVIGRELFELSPAGAYAARIGHSGDGSSFTCSAPVLNQLWTWSWRDVPSGTFSARLLGVPLDQASGGLMDAASSTWVDLFSSPYVLEFSLFATGTGSAFVPNSPAFLGVRLNVQSFSIPASIVPLGSSNAMSIVFGT